MVTTDMFHCGMFVPALLVCHAAGAPCTKACHYNSAAAAAATVGVRTSTARACSSYCMLVQLRRLQGHAARISQHLVPLRLLALESRDVLPQLLLLLGCPALFNVFMQQFGTACLQTIAILAPWSWHNTAQTVYDSMLLVPAHTMRAATSAPALPTFSLIKDTNCNTLQLALQLPLLIADK